MPSNAEDRDTAERGPLARALVWAYHAVVSGAAFWGAAQVVDGVRLDGPAGRQIMVVVVAVALPHSLKLSPWAGRRAAPAPSCSPR